MQLHIFHVLFWLSFMWPSVCSVLELEPDFSEGQLMYITDRRRDKELLEPCHNVRPRARDVVRRLYAILPYFDRDHSNSAFLHKFRATLYGMSEGEDLFDREGAYYAAILTPLVFLQQYRDAWCLLERFHRSLRLYQALHPAQKRSALKILQNFKAVNQKISTFILELPGAKLHRRPTRLTTSSPAEDPDDGDEEVSDKKDIRYLKELIKNLG